MRAPPSHRRRKVSCTTGHARAEARNVRIASTLEEMASTDRTRDGAAALAGLIAAALALGVAELGAGAADDTRSLVFSVGDAVIDNVPGDVERWAIDTFGTADKPVLVGGILVLSGLFGAVLGVLAARRFLLGALGFGAFAVIGALAASADQRSNTAVALVIGVVGAGAGIVALRLLLRAVTGSAADAPSAAPAMPGRGVADRRRFLGTAGAVAGLAAVSAAVGRALVDSGRVERLREAIRIPRPARPAPPVPAAADLEIAGLTPLFVPNEDFYRIDTALTVPRIDPAEWSLEVSGMVDNPFRLTYDELLSMDHIEADITLSCVSNEVGGGLVGNARWQGVPLRVLLDRAGVQEGGTQLFSRSVDGFTAGFPTLTALDLEEAMVAVAMNGVPLPAEHGFPARLVVPGIYGYVSATKWLQTIELTGWDVDGYWIPRGWAKEGPVKTQSRIDVPRNGATVEAGEAVIAGVAWAPTRGIEAVEVRIDDGPWQEATLAARLDVDCWRQWFLPWETDAGVHHITVRATDGAGEVQTDERTPVAPDGASGHHEIRVQVRET